MDNRLVDIAEKERVEQIDRVALSHIHDHIKIDSQWECAV